ncbi:MAG: hypothetical protein MSIBF_02795 [Candidatus Altiarchaeales archaeon IMC4]|nr:MAG: hypothetical protein MSIBF_02795 [Candidatus Altiarchaeales archaeon IMC4]
MPMMRKDDWSLVIKTTGEVLMVMGIVLLVPGIIAAVYGFTSETGKSEIIHAIVFLSPGLLCLLAGYFMKKRFDIKHPLETKHAFITSALVWLVIPLFGTVPFLAEESLGFSPLDCYFESISGFTTIGMTFIDDLDNTYKPLLFYRSFMQWIGGVGIIVLFLMAFTRSGTALSHLYKSEARADRIKPSMTGTAIEIWKIYGFYTIACALLLFIAGIPFFEAENHAMTAVSTGGFSTHGASMATFNGNPFVMPVIMFFMVIGSLSFFLHFRILGGEFSAILKSEEFRFLTLVILAATALVCADLALTSGSLPMALHDGVFQVIATVTTTGYTITDISQWSAFSKTILIALMVIGGGYGSTSGGIKALRALILIKVTWQSLRRFSLPKSAVVPVKIMGRSLTEEDIKFTMGLTTMYVVLMLAGVLVFVTLDYGGTNISGLDALSISVSSLSNVGPTFLPDDVWFAMPGAGKIMTIILLYAGRLEIFPVFVMLAALLGRRR